MYTDIQELLTEIIKENFDNTDNINPLHDETEEEEQIEYSDSDWTPHECSSDEESDNEDWSLSGDEGTPCTCCGKTLKEEKVEVNKETEEENPNLVYEETEDV